MIRMVKHTRRVMCAPGYKKNKYARKAKTGTQKFLSQEERDHFFTLLRSLPQHSVRTVEESRQAMYWKQGKECPPLQKVWGTQNGHYPREY